MGDREDAKTLHDAVEFANAQIHPVTKKPGLPRCVHGTAVMDWSGERLEPSCGCRYRETVRIGKFLHVHERLPVPGRKTKSWDLLSEDGGHLGVIEWHSPWRCYVVEPQDLTIFHAGCLRDIAVFLDKVKKERI